MSNYLPLLIFDTFRILEAVINYAYTDDVELTTNNATNIFLLAHSLQCQGLMAKCIDYLAPR